MSPILERMKPSVVSRALLGRSTSARWPGPSCASAHSFAALASSIELKLPCARICCCCSVIPAAACLRNGVRGLARRGLGEGGGLTSSAWRIFATAAR